VLGLGDAAAAVVGQCLGRIRWPGSTRTLEGSAALFAVTALALLCVRASEPAAGPSSARICAVAAGLALFEASTSQLDNLVLPIFAAAALAAHS